jgi:hypothetical protein
MSTSALSSIEAAANAEARLRPLPEAPPRSSDWLRPQDAAQTGGTPPGPATHVDSRARPPRTPRRRTGSTGERADVRPRQHGPERRRCQSAVRAVPPRPPAQSPRPRATGSCRAAPWPASPRPGHPHDHGTAPMQIDTDNLPTVVGCVHVERGPAPSRHQVGPGVAGTWAPGYPRCSWPVVAVCVRELGIGGCFGRGRRSRACGCNGIASYFVDVWPFNTVFDTSCQVEALRTWRVRNRPPGTPHPGELEVHWEVKNHGPAWCQIDVWLAYVK